MKYLVIILFLPVLTVAQNNLRFAKFEKNPDGEVGTLFIDLGGTLLIDGIIKYDYPETSILEDTDFTTKQSSFNIGIGLPLTNNVTVFGNYIKPKLETNFDNLIVKPKGYTLSFNLRFYIGIYSDKEVFND